MVSPRNTMLTDLTVSQNLDCLRHARYPCNANHGAILVLVLVVFVFILLTAGSHLYQPACRAKDNQSIKDMKQQISSTSIHPTILPSVHLSILEKINKYLNTKFSSPSVPHLPLLISPLLSPPLPTPSLLANYVIAEGHSGRNTRPG